MMNPDEESPAFASASVDGTAPADPVSDPQKKAADRRYGNSIAKFLYTQNPFYLISCLLVIYGCQDLAISHGDAFRKAVSMTSGIAAYTFLMAVICITVVRWCHIWQDARSIFLVVLIGLVALTTGFDELCISDQRTSVLFSIGVGTFAFFVIESLRRICRLGMSGWYWTAIYVHFAILVVFPLWLGDAVESRNDLLANWGAVAFSWSVAAGLLVLIPALRRGPAGVHRKGTPWTWPLYPLSAFVVLIALAAIRTHAIWMSFGFYGAAGRFEPFLMLPIFAAIMVLIAETGIGLKRDSLKTLALVAAPVALLCGVSNGGKTWLPIQSELDVYCGSSWSCAIVAVGAIYAWMAIRGIRIAALGVPAALWLGGISAPLPEVLDGADHWMLAALASLTLLFVVARFYRNDWMWTMTAASFACTIPMMGQAYRHPELAAVATVIFAIFAALLIGFAFDTELGKLLRQLAASAMMLAAGYLTVRFLRSEEQLALAAIAATTLIAFSYSLLVYRKGWLYVGAIQLLLLVALVAWQSKSHRQDHWFRWPIVSGIGSLGVGLAITTSKSGVCMRLARLHRRKRRPFLPGL